MTEQLRLMAVHAHPDDESSKGAATMARYVAEGVKVLDDPETSVAVLAAPRAIIEETPAVEAIEGVAEGAPEPEVIGKGPGEEEEAEGGDESPGKKGGDSSGKK